MLRNNILLIGLFIFFLSYAVYFHWNLHKNIHSTNTSEVITTWVQPQGLTDNFSNTVGHKTVAFNYPALEELLWGFVELEQGQLTINSETEKFLESACAYIDNNLSDTDHQQLKFLIEKSLLDAGGNQVGDLLIKYCTYLEIYSSTLARANATSSDQQLVQFERLLDDIHTIQVQLFGPEISEKLFAKKNISLEYFTQQRIVSLRGDLSLQKSYKNKISGH